MAKNASSTIEKQPSTQIQKSISELGQQGQIGNSQTRFYRLLAQEMQELSDKFDQHPKQWHAYTELITQEIAGARKKADATAEKFAKAVTKIQTIIDGNQSELDNVIKRAKEFAKYEVLDKYFETKAMTHNKLFAAWLGSFFALMAITLGCIIAFKNKIEPMLPSLNNGEFNLGSSTLVIAITLIVVWLLRVCIRLAMLNLQLGEDASNRTVLIRTLAALESESDGGVLPNEQKIIAYNAIFRASLSDNSNLDVAQPSIGDLGGLMKPK